VSLCLVVLAIGAWMALEVVQRLLLVLLPVVVALLLASVLARPTGWLRWSSSTPSVRLLGTERFIPFQSTL